MKKILVIEDEPEMRRNITALLRYKEYEPIAAENGRLGVEAARREKPDLILCDVMMPELDGHGVLQALQADVSLARIPFIFLTAKGEKDDLRSGMNLGADDYLTKPVANADLVRAIETRLRRSGQQANREFKPDFSSAEPLLKLALTPRAAEALLWEAAEPGGGGAGRRVGFVDLYLDTSPANVFLQTLRGPLESRGFTVAGATATRIPESRPWAEKNDVPFFDDAAALNGAVDFF